MKKCIIMFVFFVLMLMLAVFLESSPDKIASPDTMAVDDSVPIMLKDKN